jgi:hypothetical protein
MTLPKLDRKFKVIDEKSDPDLNKEFKSLVLRGRDQLSHYAAQMDLLFSETSAPSTVRWSLLESWLLYNPETEPIGILIWKDQVLVAAGLLALQHQWGFCRITKIGVEGEPYCLPARDNLSGYLLGEGLINALRSIKKPWFLCLTDLSDTDPVANSINIRLKLNKISILSKKSIYTYSPQLWFDRPNGLNHYLSHDTRSAVVEAENKIKDAGLTLAMQWLSEPCEIGKSLDEIIHVHHERNRLKPGLAILDELSEAALFRETVLNHAKATRIRLLTLRIDGSLAAFSIGVLDRDMLWVYANLASPDWLSYSTGTIINAEIVRSAYSDPSIKGVNWGAGLERSKMSGNVRLIPSIKLLGWSSWPTHLAWLGGNKMKRALSFSNFISAGRNQKKNAENDRS